MNNVEKFINDNIKSNTTVVISCSGGPDSMCLLSLILKFRNIKNLNVIVAHVNHKTRIECDSEEEFVKEVALKNNCIFKSITLDEYLNNEFNEADARDKRYSFLDNLAKEYKVNYVLTAHHGDDLMETVLMRLTRGSNLNGYVGIKSILKNNNYTILRPLLYVTKEDILKYNKDNNIEYVIDKSNFDEEHTRNRYRKHVLPFLKSENKDVHLKYLKFSKELENYNSFVNQYIKNNNYIKDNMILLDNIKNESSFIKRKCVELVISNIQKDDYLDVNDKQIESILSLMDKDNKQISLTNGYICQKDYNILKIVKEEIQKKDYLYILNNDLETDTFKITYNKESNDDSNYVIRLLSDEISMPLMVRNRKNGDKMAIKNLNGTKKVKDIFIDEKICNDKRDIVPLVVNNKNEVIWIPGVKKSKFSKEKNEKYDIILKYEVKK